MVRRVGWVGIKGLGNARIAVCYVQYYAARERLERLEDKHGSCAFCDVDGEMLFCDATPKGRP